MSTKDIILKQLADNPVLIYMKGVPTAPECGFSAKAISLLNATQVPYAYVNVMQAPFIREKLPSISRWPTFPQLFVNAELIGGADIIEAMSNDGSLLQVLQAATKPVTDDANANTITHSEVEALILRDYPGAQIAIEGEGCNLSIRVVSSAFADMALVKQHQGVMQSLSEPLASGRLHAVTLKTQTAEQQQPSQAPGLLQIQS